MKLWRRFQYWLYWRRSRHFARFIMPPIRSVNPLHMPLLTTELVRVQPMNAPEGRVFYLDYTATRRSETSYPGWKPIRLSDPEGTFPDWETAVDSGLKHRYVTHLFTGTMEEFHAQTANYFVEFVEPGDHCVFFDMGGWGALAGRRGYAIIRQGFLVTSRITALS